jgi:hypothetical protein
MTLRVVWTAYRSGLPVELPDWRPPASSGFVLHRAVLRGKSPDTGDGVTYPFAAGFTDYFLLVPPTPDDGDVTEGAGAETPPTKRYAGRLSQEEAMTVRDLAVRRGLTFNEAMRQLSFRPPSPVPPASRAEYRRAVRHASKYSLRNRS